MSNFQKIEQLPEEIDVSFPPDKPLDEPFRQRAQTVAQQASLELLEYGHISPLVMDQLSEILEHAFKHGLKGVSDTFQILNAQLAKASAKITTNGKPWPYYTTAEASAEEYLGDILTFTIWQGEKDVDAVWIKVKPEICAWRF